MAENSMYAESGSHYLHLELVFPRHKHACLPCAQHMSKESQRVARYRARMETVDKWMAKRRLPLKLRSRIGHYYAEVNLFDV